MDPNRDKVAKEIFASALEKEDAAARARYLAEACGADPDLRQEVESLLQAHTQAGQFLQPKPTQPTSPAIAERPGGGAVDPATVRVAPPGEEEVGTVIGHYKLLEKIGEGGFGAVYVAEQREPVKRHVALKIIKLGMDTRQVVARFEAERQALALMDHPNIAKVLDAGATETGRPFFVMELVKGIKITDYCDQNSLSTRERLDLFIQVCHAIQHAHQKGIIHRDIKPSNILVTLHDGVPVPKVIDFGIAKATQGELTDKTVYTQLHQFIGTPAYMSPEQAEMSGLDVDTRGDIYSLGVLLYELLTGQTPFDAQKLMAAGLDEMRRIIREQEPVRPSTRLSTMVEGDLTTVAKHRQADPPKLVHFVRGDLDWIVMKCLEKDRTRRYETANGLAHDILRHLSHEPVVARPPSKLYRFQKLVRRNKVIFAATGAVAVVLVLGAIVSAWEAVRATRAEQEQNRQRQVADKARAEAEQARDTVESQRQRAESGERLARLHLYAADMVLAQQALEQGNLGRTTELLEKYLPTNFNLSTPTAPPATDLRDWEWRYIWGRSRDEALYKLEAHQRVVDFVVFSDDGTLLATSSQDWSVKIWDMAARRELAAISFPSKPSDLCFVPKSRTVAVGVGKEVRFLEGRSGRETAAVSCEGYVRSMAFSREGSRLAIYQSKLLRVLDALSQRERWRVPMPSGWRVVFSPDGALLAAASNDGAVFLLDAATGQQLASLPGFKRSYLGSLVFSPDGALLACASGEGPKVFIYEVKTRQQLRVVEAEGSFIGGVAFSPDGKTMAISGGPHEIILYDRKTWQEARRLQGHLDEAWALAFSPDGKILASGSKDTTVRVRDLDPNPLKPAGGSELDLPGDMDAFSLSADGSKLCVLTTNDTYAVWDTATLRPLAKGPLPFTNIIHRAAGGWTRPWTISLDGRRLFTPTPTGQVLIWDAETRESLAVLETEILDFQVLALSPDERTLGVAGSDGVVRLWDLPTQALVRKLPRGPSSTYSLAFSPDSQLLAVGFGGGQVEAWQISGPRKLLSSHFHTMLAHALAISSDHRFLAAAGVDARVTLWDLQKGTLIKAFRGALNSYNCVALSRDGRRVFASGNPGTLSVWATDSLQSVGTFRGYRGGMGGLAILGGSDTVVSVSGDGLRLWRAPSFAEIEAAEKAERKAP